MAKERSRGEKSQEKRIQLAVSDLQMEDREHELRNVGSF